VMLRKGRRGQPQPVRQDRTPPGIHS
jgi:hypothetical protein